MNPISALQAIGAAIAAFVLGAIVAGVPAYLIGHGNGRESKAEAVGALKTSVDSCTQAAKEAERVAKDEQAASKDREQRILQAIDQNASDQAAALARIGKLAAYKPRGATECEQLSNAVDDLFRGGKR